MHFQHETKISILLCSHFKISFLWQSSFSFSQRLNNYSPKAAEGSPTVFKTRTPYQFGDCHYEDETVMELGYLLTLPKIYIENNDVRSR